jgi:hypothetical protein
MRFGSKSFIKVDEDDVRDVLVDKDFGAFTSERRNGRENTARGSTSESSRRGATLAKQSAEEYWQGMIAPDPAFYLKDDGQRK